ncbi:MAG: response regulator receiver domain [Albidovulum sp.]|nr:response regulator receiver domain [Albidovulum sp.]
MENTESPFESDRIEAARSFAQTLIVVDDEAGNQTQEHAINDLEPLKEPKRADSNQEEGGGDQIRTSSRASNPLDQKSLIDSALKAGLVCAVVRPNKGEDMAEQVAIAAERADIVSLDWQMGDKGDKAIKIINEIIKSDSLKGGRLRLIAIYTGDRNFDEILKKVEDSIPQCRRDEYKFSKADNRIESKNGLRIVWLLKSGGTQLSENLKNYQVGESDLAERLLVEFSKLSKGLLSNVALATIGALRDSTHHTLGKFTDRMDGPYFHHRALLSSPIDAQDYAVSIVLSDLKSAVDRGPVGDKFAGANAISNRINSLPIDNDNFKLKSLNGTETDLAKEKAEKIITSGYDSVKETVGITKKDAKKKFTSIFFDSLQDGCDAMLEFASLTGVRRHPNGKVCLPEPCLVQGTVIHSEGTGFLLCLQAPCDTVRVDKGTSFFFIPLEKCTDSEPDHVVPTSENPNSFLKLNFARNAYTNARSLKFPVSDPNNGRVVGAKKEAGGSDYFFKDTEGNEYRWVADLKSRRASRAAQQISRQISRIGFDEFEPFRKGT